MLSHRVILALTMCMTASDLTQAQNAHRVIDLGQQEFQKNCAVCHGSQGHGDGPFAAQLNIPVPDLATLSQRNGGIFPFERVYGTIDGTQVVKGHGTRQMPIWGQAYAYEAERDFFISRAFPWDAQPFVQARILALTEYLARLQAKAEPNK